MNADGETDLFFKNRFDAALDIYRLDEHKRFNIGTYKEKTLHMVIKHFTEPDSAYHEVRVGRFTADILRDSRIFEIQTRDFSKLRPKLEAFLPEYSVTVIYPVPYTKYVSWIDPETAEISPARKSPKRGNVFCVFPELYKIKMFLSSPALSLRILLLDVTEYRLKNGWGNGGKRGSERYDRVPTGFVSQLDIRSPADYTKLIPASLPDTFTSADFAKAASLSSYLGSSSMTVLNEVGAVRRVGKIKNAYIYERRNND